VACGTSTVETGSGPTTRLAEPNIRINKETAAMSLLHLIVRRHSMAPSPARRAQRGCTLPPFLRDAAAVSAPDSRRAVDDAPREGLAQSAPAAAPIEFRKRPLP
jgi:hypothetical protein